VRFFLQAKAEHKFVGKVEDNYLVTAKVATESLVWSTCGVTGPIFNVNSQATVDCNKDAILSVDTQDTKFHMKLRIQWKKCKH